MSEIASLPHHLLKLLMQPAFQPFGVVFQLQPTNTWMHALDVIACMGTNTRDEKEHILQAAAVGFLPESHLCRGTRLGCQGLFSTAF